MGHATVEPAPRACRAPMCHGQPQPRKNEAVPFSQGPQNTLYAAPPFEIEARQALTGLIFTLPDTTCLSRWPGTSLRHFAGGLAGRASSSFGLHPTLRLRPRHAADRDFAAENS